MAAVIAFISQKGGVGKSTLARALAREAAMSGLKVKIADLDPDQATILDWHKVRTQRAIDPPLSVELFRTAAQALTGANGHDLLVIDGPAKASGGTTEIAKRADLIVQPTGAARDDLNPAIRVFHGLIKQGISPDRLVFALNHIGTKARQRSPELICLRQATPPFLATCRSGRRTDSHRMMGTLSPKHDFTA